MFKRFIFVLGLGVGLALSTAKHSVTPSSLQAGQNEYDGLADLYNEDLSTVTAEPADADEPLPPNVAHAMNVMRFGSKLTAQQEDAEASSGEKVGEETVSDVPDVPVVPTITDHTPVSAKTTRVISFGPKHQPTEQDSPASGKKFLDKVKDFGGKVVTAIKRPFTKKASSSTISQLIAAPAGYKSKSQETNV